MESRADEATRPAISKPVSVQPVREVFQPRHRLRTWAKRISELYPEPPPTIEPQYPLTVVCISDTHNTQPIVPEGDLLLHAGDLTEWGTFDELQAQLNWLNAQPHRHKVIIAGNHDLLLDEAFLRKHQDRFGHYLNGKIAADLDWGSVIYLRDEAVTLHFPVDSGNSPPRRLEIYGCPTTPLYGTSAFQQPRDEDIWSNTVPKDTDILLTHGPPWRHLDGGLHSGCTYLAREVARVRPRLVVFGHIHVGHGREDVVLHSVRAAYEGILGYWRGWPALLEMGLRLVVAKVFGARDSKLTTFVNAAVVGGTGNVYQMDPVVARI